MRRTQLIYASFRSQKKCEGEGKVLREKRGRTKEGKRRK